MNSNGIKCCKKRSEDHKLLFLFTDLPKIDNFYLDHEARLKFNHNAVV